MLALASTALLLCMAQLAAAGLPARTQYNPAMWRPKLSADDYDPRSKDWWVDRIVHIVLCLYVFRSGRGRCAGTMSKKYGMQFHGPGR